MAEPPLDPVYAVVFIDALNVKIREGQVANLWGSITRSGLASLAG